MKLSAKNGENKVYTEDLSKKEKEYLKSHIKNTLNELKNMKINSDNNNKSDK